MITIDLCRLVLNVERLLDAIDKGNLSLDAPNAAMTDEAVEIIVELEQTIADAYAGRLAPDESLRRLRAGELLARRVLDPDDLGFSVSASVRDTARIALGIRPCETIESLRQWRSA